MDKESPDGESVVEIPLEREPSRVKESKKVRQASPSKRTKGLPEILTLLWMAHAPIVAEPLIRPAVLLGRVTVILLLPLAVPHTGVAAVVAAIAAVCVLLIAVTIAPESVRQHSSPKLAPHGRPRRGGHGKASTEADGH